MNTTDPPGPSYAAGHPPELPQTHPLATVPLDEAVRHQHNLLACVARHFEGQQLFEADAGVVPELGRPHATARVEEVLADFFGTEAAALVQGAGTGAIRAALQTVLTPGEPLLVHRAPIYRTTEVTLRGLGVEIVEADFNDPTELAATLATGRFRHAYLQHSRQRLADSYDPAAVIGSCHAAGVQVLVDDNYTALRVPRCGVELGARASCFSLFKLHGPEGVGVVLGDRGLVEDVHRDNYSGGGQVQGQQALDALRALTHVPVLWSLQSTVGTEIAERLAAGEVPGVAEVRLANVQDRCLVVRLSRPVARRLPAMAARHGGAPYPVGANSRYEIAPMFYRMSSASLDDAPELADWTVRINPMRAGADLVLQILTRSLRDLRDLDDEPPTEAYGAAHHVAAGPRPSTHEHKD